MSRILIVDDDSSVRDAMRLWLETNGHQIVESDSGPVALQAVKSDHFDLAIVDIYMPGMDGIETITALRRSAVGLPVIAISGVIPQSTTARTPDFLAIAGKLGATATLAKPFRPKDLLNAVETCLAASPPIGNNAAGSAGP
jgi:CheY-like chemotaxis protein